MFNLVFWPLVIGLAPLALSIACQSIAGERQIPTSAPDESTERAVDGDCPPRRARCRRSPSDAGARWGAGIPGRMRIDGGEGRRGRPARLRSPSW